MRDCKRFFKGMSIVPYIIMVWLPLFFAWRETVEQIRLPDARQIGLLLNSVKLGGLACTPDLRIRRSGRPIIFIRDGCQTGGTDIFSFC